MKYTKTDWISNKTPVNARNMNHIEQGISDCVREINKLDDSVVSLEDIVQNKQRTFIINATDTFAVAKSTSDVSFYMYSNSTHEFENKTAELLNGDYDGLYYRCSNECFDSVEDVVELDIELGISAYQYFIFRRYATDSVFYAVKNTDLLNIINYGDDVFIADMSQSCWKCFDFWKFKGTKPLPDNPTKKLKFKRM